MHSIALLPERERKEFVDNLTDEQAAVINYDWEQWARGKQLPPDDTLTL